MMPEVYFKKGQTKYDDIDKEVFKYYLSTFLYVPAIQKEMIYKIIDGKTSDIVTFAICLEDSVGDLGEEEAINNLKEILKYYKEKNNKKLPFLFIRIKNYRQLSELIDDIEKYKDIIKGLVLPKADSEFINKVSKLLDKANCNNLYIIPIIETLKFVDPVNKNDEFKKLRESLILNSEKIIMVRIGITDILGAFGIRRSKEFTIYDNSIIKTFIADLLATVKSSKLDIEVSGGVYEYYNFSDSVVKDNFIKEIKLDKLNGLFGKTIIHPKQVEYVRNMQAITYEDYMDATSIIRNTNSEYGVHASNDKSRMNEIKPHLRWASRTLKLADIYGVLNKGVSYDELFR